MLHHVDLTGSFRTPDIPVPQAATRRELDRAVAVVASRKHTWLGVDVRERAALLSRCIDSTFAVAREWVEHTLAERRVPPNAPYAGLEWLLGPSLIVRNMRELRDSLLEIAREGRPRIPGRIRARPDGILTVEVFPRHTTDLMLLPGYSAEVWMGPGVTIANLDAHIGGPYRAGAQRSAGLCVVLGAGNISALAPNDVLYQMFARDHVCVLKLSPVLESDAPYLERAFAPLIDAGFLRIVRADTDGAIYLAHHPKVDLVQLTGTDKTHDSLLYGAGADGERRKAVDDPILKKPLLAECSGVAPVLVVPGDWTPHEIELQAENVASSLVLNAGFTCVTPRVLVMDRGWKQRGAFLDAIRRMLASAPTRYPFHPGARDRVAQFREEHPDAEVIGSAANDRQPWILITGLDPNDDHETAFHVDPFAAVLCETALDTAGSPARFLDAATSFCNDRLWGTLNAMVVVHPHSLLDPETNAAFDRALVGLRYGNIVVNAGPGLPYLLTSPPWGAYPGNTRTNVGSGIGVVHNTLLLDDTLKTISRAPFRPVPKPPWFITNPLQRELLETLANWEATHSPGALLHLLGLGVRAQFA